MKKNRDLSVAVEGGVYKIRHQKSTAFILDLQASNARLCGAADCIADFAIQQHPSHLSSSGAKQ